MAGNDKESIQKTLEFKNIKHCGSKRYIDDEAVYSVSAISVLLKECIESAFFYIKIQGEISGYKISNLGHIYFNLKDDAALINVVCWRNNAPSLNYKLEDGMQVICSGMLTTYQGRSSYQLMLSHVEIAGIGELMALFEKRKQALAKDGVFDISRKKRLPYLPKKIAIITSCRGSVLHDILHRIRDRCPVEVVIFDVAVQGKDAPFQIRSTLQKINKLQQKQNNSCDIGIDFIIIARGGGSIEDLWAFNEESVVRAIYESSIPIVAAIGHETDTTLACLASDMRAPTPTAAIELALPLYNEIIKINNNLCARSKLAFRGIVSKYSAKLQNYCLTMQRCFSHLLQLSSYQLEVNSVSLKALSIDILRRSSHALFTRGDVGNLVFLINNKYEMKYFMLSSYVDRVNRAMHAYLQKHYAYTELLKNKLERYNYKIFMSKGFSLILDKEGKAIDSAYNLIIGQEVMIQMHDGEVRAMIIKKND